ncbi:MAG: hypothetical protein KF729_03005 [Sandaracinaceae bacterium]|nr:hypothetical protein [Sandaracinaceae bacterium]
MADEVEGKKRRRRGDGTEELGLEELQAFEPPTGELDVAELQPISRPPPAPGLGRPGRPPAPKKKEKTLSGVPAPMPPPEHADLTELDEHPTDPAQVAPEEKPEPPTVPPPSRQSAVAIAPPVAVGAPERPSGSKPRTPRKRPSLPEPRTPSVPPPPPRTPAPAPKAPAEAKIPAAPKTPATEAKAVAAAAKPAPRATPSAPPRRGSVAPPPVGRPPSAPEEPTEATTEMPALRSPDDEAREADLTLRDLCEAELARGADADRSAQLHYELGRLYELRLEDPARSAQHYQDALRARPDHAAAIRGARRMLGATGRWATMPALYDAEIALTREPRERARLLYRKARLMEEELRQAQPALGVYREALALDPGNVVILKAIERALRRDKAWGPLEATYAQLANAVESPALRAAWTAVRAQLTETQLRDPVQAAALYEAALEADPHASDALAHVKRLGKTQRRWPQLVEALLTEHSLAEDASARLSMLVSIAGIEERLMGDAEAAIETLGEALEAAPGEPSILRELARLHRDAGRHAEEIDALILLVDAITDAAEQARLCHHVGHVYDQLLGEPASAERWYQRTLTLEPGHRAAALALTRLLGQAGRWAEVVAVWERRVEDGVSSPAERAELHSKIGELFERELRDPVGAARHHAQALGLDPDHHRAFDALTRLYAAAARWTELAELYERAVARAAHDDEAIMWLFRLGAVREDRLLDARGALEAYERVLERAPTHRGALHAIVRAGTRAGEPARVVAALRQEAEQTKDPARAAALLHRAATLTAYECGDPGAAIRALEALLAKQPKHRASLETLAELLSDAGRWAELVAVYGRLLPLTPTATDKVRLHHRIGEIHETQIGDAAAAIAAYRAALQLDPEFEPAREALLLALRRVGAWPELAEAIEQRIGRLRTPIERARAATELGALVEERLGDTERALGLYERALDEVPLHHPALDARARLLTEASKWNELGEALEAEAAAHTDPFLRLQASLRAALVRAEQQGAIGPALEAFRPVFERHPDHVGALLAVESIYGRTRDDAGLAATYEKMAEVLDDERATLATLHELARARAAAGAPTAAIAERILQTAPRDPDALEQLAADARARGDHARELEMEARLAEVASDSRLGAFHQTRVGELLLAKGRPVEALAAFRAAIALDPASLGATRGLSRAALLAEDPAAAREASKRERDVTGDRYAAVGLLLRAAHMRLTAAQIDEAAEDYTQAISLDPDDARAAAGLRATLSRPDQAPLLIELLGRAALACRRRERAAELHLAVADLQAATQNDLAAAVVSAERALEKAPDDLGVLAKLADYLERAGRWEDAALALERLIPKARDQRLLDAHLKLATLAETRLADPERAIRSLRVVLSRDEDNEPALAALVRLERLRDRHEEALRLAKKLMQVVKTDGQKAHVLTELAELERARGQNAAAAASAFSALGIQGPSQRAAEVYKELIANAPEHASWDHYATGLMTFVERNRGKGGNALSATYRELAWVFGAAHNRPDRAIATLREGIEECPADPTISLALVKALRDVSANDKAIVEVRRLLGIDAWNANAWRALADVFRATGEPDGAAIALTPLVAMKQATDAEIKTVRARHTLVARAPSGILGRQGLEQIIDHGALNETATGLVHALADVLGKLEGFDHDRHGVSKRDRIRQGDPHPLRTFADRIGRVFGVPEYDLYVVSSSELDWAAVFPGSPPTLVVPTRLEDARDPVLAFALARPLALMSRLLHPVDRIDPITLERILVASVRHFEPGFALREDEPDLERETRRVGKAIGFFARGRVQEAAASFATAPTRDVARWVRDVRRMAARAALLVADDLLAAYEALGADVGSDDLVADLARFWVSDPAIRFRRRVAQQL